MNQFDKIVLLIDADNAQSSKTEAVLKEVSAYGRIVIKRAYGNWSKPALQSWEKEIKRFAISAIQQFDFASGKNASDMALTIDAMELLYAGKYDCFVIVSSDSDFTSLAIKLHEAGVYVIGYGKLDTVESFRNACDEFNYVEALDDGEEPLAPTRSGSGKRSSSKSGKKASGSAKGRQEDKQEKKQQPEEPEASYALTLAELEELIRIAEEKYADDTGFVNVAAAGTYIRRVRSDYNIKAFGYSKLSEYIRDNPKKYEIEEREGKGTKLLMFRCKKQTSGRRRKKTAQTAAAG